MTNRTATEILNAAIDRGVAVAAKRATDRAMIAEKIAGDFVLTSFDYDALIDGDAAATVWLEISSTVAIARKDHPEDGDEKVLAYLERLATRRALTFRAPASSSASSNQAELAQHTAWLAVFALLTGN